MAMKYRYFFFLAIIIFFTACKSGAGIFTKKTNKEKYFEKIKKTLPESKTFAWQLAAEKSLLFPQKIDLPYAEAGINITDTSDATAFQFNLTAGQMVSVEFKNLVGGQKNYFREFYEVRADSSRKLLADIDTTLQTFTYANEMAGRYIFHFQPQISTPGEYSITINAVPYFAFPVDEKVKSNISSFWGAQRDGGARSHEGIDIFAKRGTPVVAVADGQITRVATGGLGGKHIFLGLDSMDVNVYYAHLDSQMVQTGQWVKRGEVLGTVGNTGNAITTAPHLHFGVYSGRGAVDPITFVQRTKTITSSTERPVLPGPLKQTNAKTKVYEQPDNKSSVLPQTVNLFYTVIATNKTYFRILLSDGRKGYISIK